MMASVEPRPLFAPDVLGQLLHSLCQPLTTLHCSLELAMDQAEQSECEAVSVALEQADRAIETVRLMREYLEIERDPKPVRPVALAPALHTVLTQLSVVAEARCIPLLASGSSTAVLVVNEFWLQRSLRYLIETLLESPARGKALLVVLEDRGTRAQLSIHCVSRPGSQEVNNDAEFTSSHLRQAKLVIAQSVLESAGARVELCSGNEPSIVIRVPQTKVLVHKLSA